MRSTKIAALGSLCVAAIAAAAWGADLESGVEAGANNDSAADSSTGQIEEVVVTAQRREEPAQRVPISLQAFSADSLARTAVRSTEDLSSVVGGLLIQPTAARPAIFLRGVGTNSSNTTPAVQTFVDGVYQPFGQSLDFANIASLEVLKGPQGTLFGRNATGGVIQVTTRPPSETPAARAEVGYGDYNTEAASAYITGGVAHGVAMDLSLSNSYQGTGFGKNVYNDDDVFLTRKFSARSRIRAEISDVTSLTLAADFSQNRGTVGANVSPAVGYDSLFVNGAIRRRGDFYPGDFDVNAGPSTPYWKSREWGTSLSLQTQFAGLTLRNITSYRQSAENIRIDFDGGPANLVNLRINREPRSAVSEELQLLSGNDSRLQWVTGLFYFHMKADSDPFQINANAAISTDEDDSIAAYAQGTYAILPATRLTLGGRFTSEDRKIQGRVLGSGVEVPGTNGSQSQKFQQPTWRVALDHNFTPDVLGYISASRGFNAGFYNQASLAGFATPKQDPPVKPEVLKAYEIGTKTDLLGRHLRLNLSAFWWDYLNLQQQIYDQGAVVTINAGAARIKGLDFEIVGRPVASLTVSLSGTYLDAQYRSYPLAPNYVPQPNGSVIAVGNLDAAGRDITNAPDVSYTASVAHVLSMPIGDFTTSANLNYRGRSFVDPVNRFELPSRYVLNATERWTASSGHYFASLWAKNLLDKRYDYAINILTPAGLVGNTAPPRTYGFSVGLEY